MVHHFDILITVTVFLRFLYSRCSKLALDWLKFELAACWTMELLWTLDSEKGRNNIFQFI